MMLPGRQPSKRSVSLAPNGVWFRELLQFAASRVGTGFAKSQHWFQGSCFSVDHAACTVSAKPPKGDLGNPAKPLLSNQHQKAMMAARATAEAQSGCQLVIACPDEAEVLEAAEGRLDRLKPPMPKLVRIVGIWRWLDGLRSAGLQDGSLIMKELSGRTAVITGGGSGFGREWQSYARKRVCALFWPTSMSPV